MSFAKYPDVFDELKAQVRAEGLLERTPIRGSIEMIATLLSMGLVYYIAFHWQPSDSLWPAIGLGFFMTIIFTRAVFISHDILHTQYFQNKKLSFKLSYPFAAIILSNSASWWDFKHNINHHTWCNVPEKDEDILAMDGAFAEKYKGNKTWLRKTKYLVFWGAMFFMYGAFVVQSYNFVIKRKNYGELFLMLLHWPLVWGPIFYFLPFNDAITVYLTLNFTLSPWLAFGFITNHLGCDVYDKEEYEELSWMEQQMRASRSLSGGKFINWFYGGLNAQIEHHLFPKASRFHMLRIKEITKKFAAKYDMHYFETTPLEAYVQINDVIKRY